MYQPIPSRAGRVWPLAAIICLGILGLLIAATIVLALIPIYLPSKRATVINNSTNDANIFYLQYLADADPSTSQSGALINNDQIANRLGFGNDAVVEQGFIKATNDRRRRALSDRRQKRTPSSGILLRCRYKIKKECNTNSCEKNFKDKFHQRIQNLGDIDDLPCNILTAGVITTIKIKAKFVGLITTNFAAVVLGYGVVNSLVFVANKDGDFYDAATWVGGVVPFAQCSIVIPVGITVTIARGILTFPLKKFDIYGDLKCGAGNPSFQFNYPTDIFVYSGGRLEDSTSTKRFRLPRNSLITTYSGGSCGSPGTVIQTYSPSGPGDSITIISPSGPFTCGLLPSGSVLIFLRITFIAIKSGGFLFGDTYLGGIAPSVGGCSGGCGVYVPPGVTLSTADLDGELNINIVELDIILGGTVELGTGGSKKGFRFKYPIQLNVHGALSFICSGGGIYIPNGHGVASGINFFDGGSFSSIVATFIQIFDLSTGDDTGSPFDLSTVLTGPFFVIVGVDGTIAISVIGPNGSTIASSILSSTAITDTTSSSSSLSTATITSSTSSSSTTTSSTSSSSSTTTSSTSSSSTTTTTSSTSSSTTTTTSSIAPAATPSIG